MKKQLSTDVATRIQRFLDVLRAAPLETAIHIRDFQEIVEKESPAENERLKKATKREKQKALAAVERKVRYALKLAELRLGGGRSIVREDHHIKVSALQSTTFDRRLQGALPALGCHESGEANLKAEMLKLTANGLRVCVMDSRKLVGPEFNCCFAPVSLSSMDMIAIDEGFDGNASAAAVFELCETAREHGVVVLVARQVVKGQKAGKDKKNPAKDL